MRGGKFLNNWRMAELHAKEAPDRVWELETYGALFDRTPDGKISQRNFGGHEYPRLAHVGDRTGLELIRTLQQKIVVAAAGGPARDRRLRGPAQGLRRVHRHRPRSRTATARSPARSATGASPAGSSLLRGARGHPGHRRHRQVLQGHLELLGVHRRRPRARAARRRAADQHGVRAVPPDRHGLAAVGQGHPRHRVRARRRRSAAQLRGQAVHVRLRPRRLQGAVRRDRGGGRPLVQRPGQQPAPARAAAPRRGRPRDQLRGQGRPRLAARRRLPRRVDAAAGRGDHASGCRRCTTSSRSWPTSTSRRSRWRSARPATTSWAASRSTPTPRPRSGPRAVRRG